MRRLDPPAPTRHAMSVRLRDDEYDRLDAYATQQGLSINRALHKLIRDHLGPVAHRCEYATRVDSPTECAPPIDHLIVYVGSSGRTLSRDTVCHGHTDEAVNRPRRRGSNITATLTPMEE